VPKNGDSSTSDVRAAVIFDCADIRIAPDNAGMKCPFIGTGKPQGKT
jgi:hypothetical protein